MPGEQQAPHFRTIEQRLLHVVLRNNPFAQMVGVLFGGFGVIGLHDYTSPLRLYGWFSVLVLVMLHRLWAIRRYARTGNYDTPDVEAMRRRFTVGAFASGTLWASLPWIVQAETTEAVFFIAMLMVGMLAGATAAFGFVRRFFLAFTLPLFASLTVYMLLNPVPIGRLSAFVLLVFYLLIIKGSGMVAHELRNHLRAHFDADLHRKGVERQAAELASANAANLRRREMLEGMLRIATLPETDTMRKLEQLLEFGCRALGLRVGVIAETRDGERRLFAKHDPHGQADLAALPLHVTLCSQVIERDEAFSFANHEEAAARLPADYQGKRVGAFIGARVHTSEGLFGTVCFHDVAERHVPFTDTEENFVRLLASWMGAELSEYFMQRRLRAKERQLSTLADAMPCGMAALDAGGRLLYANRLFAATFNVEDMPLIGRHVSELFHGSPEFSALVTEQVTSRQPAEFEYRRPGGDEERIYRISLVPNTDEDGTQGGCFVLTLDITQDKALQSELELKASLDPLTRIYNRKYLEETLDQVLSDRRRRKPVYVALLDLDGFKQINDSAGHDAGDAILREVAATLRDALRKQDLLARYGGDEFVALLHCLDDEDLADTCEKLLQAISGRSFHYGGNDYHVGVSIGATRIRRGEPMHHLLVRADSAMYLAKRRGRNRVEIVPADESAVRIRNRTA